MRTYTNICRNINNIYLIYALGGNEKYLYGTNYALFYTFPSK